MASKDYLKEKLLLSENVFVFNDISPTKLRPNREWMTNLPEKLQASPLCSLAIPGTHNSASFSCEITLGLSPDAPPFVHDLGKIPGFGSSALLNIVQGWAKCQFLDINDQLEAGIRYFDLRMATKRGSGQLYVVHSLYGQQIGDMLKDIICFLEEHPREVVLLDFNHFYAMETEHHLMLITLLISEFGPKICERCDLNDLTLKRMWSSGKQVVIFYHNAVGMDFEKVWPGSCITCPWPNADKSDVCISKLGSYHSQPRNGFVVSQGVLTPTTASIMKNLLTANLHTVNKQLVPSLLSWIQESPATCVHQPNIIVADFADEGQFIQHVLDLNTHRILKE